MKLTRVYLNQHTKSITQSWNQDNTVENKLNKITKFNSQTNIISKGEIKKKLKKKE